MIDLSNIASMSNDELWGMVSQLRRAIGTVVQELERHEVVRCSVCGLSEIAFRGEDLPFITWSKPSGHPLCPRCTSRFKHKELPVELTVSPVDEVLALLD